jgi:hypothetical protein
MSEPAKDEADLVQCMAKAMHNVVYEGQSQWGSIGRIEQFYREMEAYAALAAIRAAGWAVVPQRQPTLEMLNAAHALKNPGNRDIYEAMIAAAPGVEP